MPDDLSRVRWLRLILGIGLLATLAGPALAQRPLGYFLEAGGHGGWASLNLDLRLASHFHARADAGLLLWPTAPLTASYVLGDGRSGLEVGGGATIFFFPPEDPDASFLQRIAEFITAGKGVGTVALASGLLGYRREHPSGFVFRATFTPFFGHGQALAWLGVSLGGAF